MSTLLHQDVHSFSFCLLSFLLLLLTFPFFYPSLSTCSLFSFLSYLSSSSSFYSLSHSQSTSFYLHFFPSSVSNPYPHPFLLSLSPCFTNHHFTLLSISFFPGRPSLSCSRRFNFLVVLLLLLAGDVQSNPGPALYSSSSLNFSCLNIRSAS